jgi:hypothetical protein
MQIYMVIDFTHIIQNLFVWKNTQFQVILKFYFE